jgi:TPR repeat protein
MKTPIAFSLLLLLAQTFPLYAHAQDASPKQLAENAAHKIEQYQRGFMKLEPQNIFDELERLQTIIAIKSRGSALPDLTDDNTLKAAAYASALEAKRKLREPVASYYWGRYYSRICGALDASKIASATTAQCWADILDSFKIASEGGVFRASFNVGLMYENGWGVPKSNYVAADWYLKAANKYDSEGNREGALEAVEAAIRVVPDHPAANRLRAQLLK